MAYWGEVEIVQGTQDIANNLTYVLANCYACTDVGSSWTNDATTAVLNLDGKSVSETISLIPTKVIFQDF